MTLTNLPTKMISKKILTFFLGTMIVSAVLAPILILAENNDNNQGGKAFCQKISESSAKWVERVLERETKIEAKREEINGKIEERWTKQDQRLLEKREKWDENRTDHFAKLEEKAKTDAQKQALVVFKEAASGAITARRAAINAALEAFRQGVQQAKLSRQLEIDAAKLTFKNAVTAAFETAKTNCASGTSLATVRQNLKDALIAAKEKYRSDYQEIETLQAAIDQQIESRRTAIEKAIQDFKLAMEKARNDFKAATGQ